MNRKKEIIATIRTIAGRSMPGGGFCEHLSSTYRTDATAWAILALKSLKSYSDIVESARIRLTVDQFKDGRLCLSRERPQPFWPTPLAIFAWHGCSAYREQQNLAIHFLLTTSSLHWEKRSNDPGEHDTSIRGWPWTEDTFAWVEPTAMSILALSLSGYRSHERVREAIKMLMNRQLPSGGWNAGSTVVYGKETYPQPSSTGIALAALSGHVGKTEIERSLHYLAEQASNCRTPLSLGWSLFGLYAWGERPTAARQWIIECLSRQEKYGAYGTTLLSLMLLAYEAKGGFLEAIT